MRYKQMEDSLQVIYKLCLKKNIDVGTLIAHWNEFRSVSSFYSEYGKEQPKFIKMLKKFRNV